MTTDTEPTDGILRRTVLNASAAAAGVLALSGTTAADEDDEEDDYNDENDDDPEVDEPEGFSVDIVAEHASFPDDVSALFTLEWADDEEGEPIKVDMEDAGTILVGEVNWEEGARSGWHRHPGMSIINMVEGEIEVTQERDCEPRTYSAGDAWMDPGEVHKADSDDGARAYLMFFGTPDGEPATEWVEPPDC
ncbi:cupin domain-containing protein [Natrialbaceae archaeon A-CW3]